MRSFLKKQKAGPLYRTKQHSIFNLSTISNSETIIKPRHHATCPCDGGCPDCLSYANLNISQPGDKFEKEADAISEQAIHIDIYPHYPSTKQSLPTGTILRQVSDEKEDEEHINADESGQPKMEHGKSIPANGFVTPNIPKDNGTPMDTRTRQMVTKRIGHEFHDVRIHDNAAAHTSARSVNAKAYTINNHIYFQNGQYNTSHMEGRRLLFHELVHVLQQRSFGPSLQRSCTSGCVGSSAPVHSPLVDPPTEPGCPVLAGTPTIRRIDVYRSNFVLQLTMRDGSIERHPCSPSLSANTSSRKSATPLGEDYCGRHCDREHTNRSGDGMSYFTGLARQNYRIGFHNSQRVGRGIESHGCIRVCCPVARKINRDTTNQTVVHVHAQEPDTSIYTVVSGDFLSGIASRQGVSLSDLREVNAIPSNSDGNLQPGQPLTIPGREWNGSAASGSRSSARTHTVQADETLGGIAQHYNTIIIALAELNNLSEPYIIHPGDVLILPENTTRTYTVQSNDTLSEIASDHNTTVETLAQLNNLSEPYTIHPGDTLILP